MSILNPPNRSTRPGKPSKYVHQVSDDNADKKDDRTPTQKLQGLMRWELMKRGLYGNKANKKLEEEFAKIKIKKIEPK